MWYFRIFSVVRILGSKGSHFCYFSHGHSPFPVVGFLGCFCFSGGLLRLRLRLILDSQISAWILRSSSVWTWNWVCGSGGFGGSSVVLLLCQIPRKSPNRSSNDLVGRRPWLLCFLWSRLWNWYHPLLCFFLLCLLLNIIIQGIFLTYAKMNNSMSLEPYICQNKKQVKIMFIFTISSITPHLWGWRVQISSSSPLFRTKKKKKKS